MPQEKLNFSAIKRKADTPTGPPAKIAPCEKIKPKVDEDDKTVSERNKVMLKTLLDLTQQT